MLLKEDGDKLLKEDGGLILLDDDAILSFTIPFVSYSFDSIVTGESLSFSIPFQPFSFSGGTHSLNFTLPCFTESFTAATGNIGNVDLEVPKLEWTLYGGNRLDISLPLVNYSFTGASGANGNLEYSIPLQNYNFTSDRFFNELKFAIPSLRFVFVSVPEITGGFDLRFPVITYAWLGSVGRVGSFNFELPVSTCVFEALQNVTGVLNSSIPIQGYVFTVDNIPTSGMSVYVVCTENLAVTQYDNYDFFDLGYFNSELLGAKPDGIYLLEGDNDQGVAINSTVITNLSNLETNNFKRASDIILTVT